MRLNPFKWFGESKADTELTLDALIERLASVNQTASGVSVNPDNALKSSTMFSIVNVMSRAIASLPFRIEQDVIADGKRRVDAVPDHPVTRLLADKPNAFMTGYEYWSLALLRLLLYGEHYAQKQMTRDGRVQRLMPLLPSRVDVKVTEAGRLRYEVTTDGGETRTLQQEQVHRIVFMSKNGLRGTSPVQEAPNAIGLEIAAEEFGSRVFGGGAIPTGIIERPGHFKDDESHKSFAKRWNAAFSKKRGTAVLEEGWKFNAIQLNNEESQFLETRKHQRTVIAGMYGIPPHKVGDLERATFSNIEELQLDYVINAMRPYLECIEAAVDRDFLTEEERESDIGSRFMTNDQLRGDIKTRSESLRIQREAGVLSANEWRAIEGMNAREDDGGDDYMTPLNFRIEGDDDEDDGGAQVVAMRRIR